MENILYFTSYPQINSKSIKEFNKRNEALKLLENKHDNISLLQDTKNVIPIKQKAKLKKEIINFAALY